VKRSKEKSLRIGINCISIDPDYLAGVNTYTFGLLDGFAKLDVRHSFVIFVTNDNKQLFQKYLKFYNFDCVELSYNRKVYHKILNRLAIYAGLQWVYNLTFKILYSNLCKSIQRNSDIIYTPTTLNFPYHFNIPSILSMHDLQHEHYSQFFTKFELKRRKLAFKLSAITSTSIQASSEYIKNDILDKYGNYLNRFDVNVINEGVNIEKFSSSGSERIHDKYGITDNYLFYPASFWPHKNHLLLFEAIKDLRENYDLEIPVLLCGGGYGSLKNKILDFIEKEGLPIYYIGRVPETDLISLYKSAHYTISVSLHESSCLPILESIAAGTPVIASNLEPNVEMTKRLKINLFESNNVKDLSRLLRQIWHDEIERENQININSEIINCYDWKNMGQQYITLFEEVSATKVI